MGPIRYIYMIYDQSTCYLEQINNNNNKTLDFSRELRYIYSSDDLLSFPYEFSYLNIYIYK
jgi:hypothetical protein